MTHPAQPVPSVSDRLRHAIRADLRRGLVGDAGWRSAVLTALEPAAADALMMDGLVRQMRGDGVGADRRFERALRLRPDHAEIWGNRAGNRAGNRVATPTGGTGTTKDIPAEWERQALAEGAVAVALDPALGPAYALRARLAYGLGLTDASVAAARRALLLGQQRMELAVLLVDGLRRTSRAAEAEDAVRAVLAAARPASAAGMTAGEADLWVLLGLLRADASDDAGATVASGRAVLLEPAHPAALVNRGNALLRQGRTEGARRAFQAALSADPGRPEAALGLGTALLDLGLWHAVPPVLEARRRLSDAANPAALWHRVGEAAAAAGDRRAALRAFGHAVRLQPADSGCRGRLALAAAAIGRHSLGEALFHDALALAPADASLLTNAAIALVDEGRVGEGVGWLERALVTDPAAHKAHSSLLFARQYLSGGTPADRRAAHRAWGTLHAAASGGSPSFANDRNPDRALRIGLVSADLKRHPVGYFLAPFLAGRDPARLTVICYANQPDTDAADPMTRALMERADAWRWIGGLDDRAAAAAIRADRIDVLIDLSGHTAHHRLPLFAHRPAPLQATWLGYPDGTGVPAIDLIVGGGLEMPEESASWFGERLLALPHGRFCYAPPGDAPLVAPLPAPRTGHVTFGSFNTLAKLSDETVALWTRVLAAVPGSRLVLKARPLGDETVGGRVRARFAAAGADPGRLDLRGWSSHRDLLADYSDIDIALDPRPFSGGLTSCEALWMGVPMVTWPNDRPAGRQSAHFLTLLGLAELVAGGPEAYVNAAAGLARDLTRLAGLRAGLRERIRSSPLLDGPGFAVGLEAGLREEWRRWCQSESAVGK